jgi:hypothetical protein
MSRAIKLVKTHTGCDVLEPHPQYDVLLYGKKIGQLYFNMRGYTGVYLPQPSGIPLNIGERSITAYRKAIARLNKEWAASKRL